MLNRLKYVSLFAKCYRNQKSHTKFFPYLSHSYGGGEAKLESGNAFLHFFKTLPLQVLLSVFQVSLFINFRVLVHCSVAAAHYHYN